LSCAYLLLLRYAWLLDDPDHLGGRYPAAHWRAADGGHSLGPPPEEQVAEHAQPYQA